MAVRHCLTCSRVNWAVFYFPFERKALLPFPFFASIPIARPGSGPEVQGAFCCSVTFILKGGRRGAEKEEPYLRGGNLPPRIFHAKAEYFIKFNFPVGFLGGGEWITISSAAGYEGSAAESQQTKGSDTSGRKSALVNPECYGWGAPLNSCQGPFPLHDVLPFCYISYGFCQWPLLTRGILLWEISLSFTLWFYSYSVRG